MRDHLNILGLLAAAAMIACAFASLARGEWVTIVEIRQTGLPGTLGEIENRLAGDTKFASDPNVVTRAHEDTHILNNYWSGGRERRSFRGVQTVGSVFSREADARWGFYMPGGNALVVPPMEIQSSAIAAIVSRQHRSNLAYNLYLVQCGDNPALALFDELSAFTCGIVAGLEAGLPWSDPNLANDLLMAKWLVYYCSLLTQYARNYGYSHWRELDDYVMATHVYLQQLERIP